MVWRPGTPGRSRRSADHPGPAARASPARPAAAPGAAGKDQIEPLVLDHGVIELLYSGLRHRQQVDLLGQGVRSRRTRSITRLRAVITSHTPGLADVRDAGQRSAAIANASCVESSALSKSPRNPADEASTRAHSSWKTSRLPSPDIEAQCGPWFTRLGPACRRPGQPGHLSIRTLPADAPRRLPPLGSPYCSSRRSMAEDAAFWLMDLVSGPHRRACCCG